MTGLSQSELDQILGGKGWDDIEKAQKLNEEEQAKVAEEHYQIAVHYHACFSTPAGQYVLNHLKSETEEKPAFAPGGPYPVEQQGLVREGQNSVYRRIKQLLAIAEEGPPHLKNKES